MRGAILARAPQPAANIPESAMPPSAPLPPPPAALAALPLLALLLAASAPPRACAAPVLAFARRATHRSPRYNTSSRVLPGAINVHIQPHSHDDVGWLKTFDEYLIGRNGSQQTVGGVQFIYDGVAQALQRDASRTFTAVEMGFAMRWFESLGEADAAAAAALVRGGQLVLTNAGWCMADEAVPTFVDMADNLALGQRLAARAFGATPTVMPRGESLLALRLPARLPL